MAQEWNQYVNQNFYGGDYGYLENTETTEFKSGRVVSNLLNSSPRKTTTLLLRCDDVQNTDGKTEAEWFLYWYENIILSGTETFYLNLAGRGSKEYRFGSIPSWNGQKSKEFSLEVQEV